MELAAQASAWTGDEDYSLSGNDSVESAIDEIVGDLDSDELSNYLV